MARNPLAGAVLRYLNWPVGSTAERPDGVTYADRLAARLILKACEADADSVAAARLVAEIVAQADPVLDSVAEED